MWPSALGGFPVNAVSWETRVLGCEEVKALNLAILQFQKRGDKEISVQSKS